MKYDFKHNKILKTWSYQKRFTNVGQRNKRACFTENYLSKIACESWKIKASVLMVFNQKFQLEQYKKILDFKMIDNNLIKNPFSKRKYLSLGRNISNLRKNFLSKNPV